MAEIYLSPADLEDRWENSFRIKVKTLANWRDPKRPRGPAFRRIGNRILYPLSAVEAFEETGEHRQAPAAKSDPPLAIRSAPERCPASDPGALPESPLIADLIAARDHARADIAARQAALRRTASRLERHYSRRIDLARGRMSPDRNSTAEPGSSAQHLPAEEPARKGGPKRGLRGATPSRRWRKGR